MNFPPFCHINNSSGPDRASRRHPDRTGLIVWAVFLLSWCPLAAQNKVHLQQFETKNAHLVFLEENASYLVPHAVRSFENALAFHERFWNYRPSERTGILFNDFTDTGNGGTSVIPRNFLNIGIAPFDYTFSVVPSNERMQWLMNHELTHQVMCDQYSSGDLRYRRLLGGKVPADHRDPVSMAFSYLTTPRWYSPRWYHEGIAVFMETWMSGGIGRVMGGYDEMVFRTMVLDSARFYRVIGLETEGTTVDFQVGVNSYLYGTRFVSYLALTHGVGKLRAFYTRNDNTRRFYADQFRQVYGIPIDEAWDQWIIWEKEFQQRNLADIRQHPAGEFRNISPEPLGSVSRQYYDSASNRLIMAVNYPGKLAHLVSMDVATGKMTTIAPVPSPSLYVVTGLAYDDSTGTIFATTQNRDWRGLQSINARTGKVKELIRFTRCGDLVFDSKSRALWGIQSLGGRTSLVRFMPPYEEYVSIMTLPYGQDFSDPAISQDGRFLSVTLSDVTGSQKLVLFKISELLAGVMDYRILHEFEDNNASGFVFSGDGQYLYGTSYYTGVSNVYRISTETGEAEILTNAETGYFRPLPISADSMILFKYSHRGMIAGTMKIAPLKEVGPITFLGQLVYEKNPEVEQWALAPPSKINLDSMHVVERPYRPIRELKLAGAYPIIQGYKKYVAGGYRFNFMDPMGINALTMKISASPADTLPLKQVPHLSLEYNYWNWTFTGHYNYADFYDLFGPTKFSRAGYSFSTRYYKVINRFTPKKTDFYFKLSMYGDLETLPGNQNIRSDYRNLFTGTANFHKSDLRKSLGAIEPEQGYDWNVYAHASFAGGDFFPQLINQFDFGFLLPQRNSSLWIRTSAGQSFGQPDKTNSYFYFGGFGNNYLEFRSAQLYREISAFPGMEIDAVSALNYGKGSVEWNARPIRFRHFGFKGWYSTYARVTLFGTALFTNLANDLPQAGYLSAGIQVDFELVLFTLLKSTLSLGYARAGRESFDNDQFMISLKL